VSADKGETTMSIRFMIVYRNSVGKSCFRILTETSISRECIEITDRIGNDFNTLDSPNKIGTVVLSENDTEFSVTTDRMTGTIYYSETAMPVWKILRNMKDSHNSSIRIKKFYDEIRRKIPDLNPVVIEEFDAHSIPNNFIETFMTESDVAYKRSKTWTVASMHDEINFIMQRHGDFVKRYFADDTDILSIASFIKEANKVRYEGVDKGYELVCALSIIRGVIATKKLSSITANNDATKYVKGIKYFDVSDEALQELGDINHKSYTAMDVEVEPWTVRDIRREMKYVLKTYRDFLYDSFKKGVDWEETYVTIINREKILRNRDIRSSIPFTIAIVRLGEYIKPKG
jgi:hypothetical protein